MVEQDRVSRGMHPGTGQPWAIAAGGESPAVHVPSRPMSLGWKRFWLVLFLLFVVVLWLFFAYKEMEASRFQWWYYNPMRLKIIDYSISKAFDGRKLSDPAALLLKETRVNKLTPVELIQNIRLSQAVTLAKGKPQVSSSKASAYRCQFTPECRTMAKNDGKLRFVVLGGAIAFLKEHIRAGDEAAEKDICLILPLMDPALVWVTGLGHSVCSQAVKEFPNSEILRKDLYTLEKSQWLKFASKL